MCGVIGAIGFGPALGAYRDRMVHRGPDDAGEYVDPGEDVYLGHRRLSILDLSPAGHQPMSLADRGHHLVYNGEVYNFQELRRDHLAGEPTASRCDTEVILRLYQHLGTTTPEHLRGMFAFGLYDQGAHRLLLCRDRLGIKPLFYYHKGRQFAFASELSALKALPGLDLEEDPEGLNDYFAFGYIPSPRTAYRYIRKLQPGHRMVVDTATRSPLLDEPYWVLRDHLDPTRCRSDEAWIEAIDEKLTEAVRLRLISDVPLGAFLSGGLDSSMVVTKMAGLMNQPVQTFTMGFEESDYDERPYAESVAQRYGTQHHVEVVRPEALALMPKLLEAFGEPFWDASAIPTYYLAQVARKHVTVALSGDGGDEVFSGYSSYAKMERLARLSRLPKAIRRTIHRLGMLLPSHLPGYGTLQRLPYDNEALFHELLSVFNHDDRRNLYVREFRERVSHDTQALYRDLVARQHLLDEPPTARWQTIDLHCALPDDMLTKVDRMSMLHSLEVRVPLLDHELVELVFSCPPALRNKNRQMKYIIRTLLAGRVPDGVLSHRKQGFGIPLGKWFQGPWREALLDLLGELQDDPIVDVRYARKLLEQHQRDGRNFGHRLYALLMYASWRCQRPESRGPAS